MSITKITRPARKLLKLKYCGAVIVAAGSASRMGGIDKVMAPLGGEPMVVRTVRQFQNCDAIKEIVIVTREDLIVPIMDLCHDFDKVKAVVAGGKTRDESVSLGLNTLSAKVKLVAVQDAARPFASWQLIDRVVRAANTYGAAAPAIPVKDTVKVVQGGIVKETPDRSTLQAVQTPQVFDFDLLRGALKQAKADGAAITDDCSAVERLGMSVKIVEGDERNIKITTPLDLKIAELFLQEESMRIGHGYDVHKLVSGRDLILGGVKIDHERGLLGHSDADVLLHAVADALLGAAGLGDIGKHFPDTDPQYQGADSMELLRIVGEKVKSAGYRVGNIDVTMIAQRPKLRPAIHMMELNIARVLDLDPGQVNVKATTEEHLGFTGKEEGMSCHAVCILEDL